MSDYGRSARRGAQAGTPSTPGRARLGKQQWKDIRRACKLGADGGVYSVELHGVKITFRFQKAHSAPAQDMALPRTMQDGQAAGRSNATAQRPSTTQTRPSDAQRPRQGERKHGSMRASQPGAQPTAGEDASKASRASAGKTAGAGSQVAQSPTACSPRRPNSRQRRSANRLVEFMRAKQGPQSVAAESPQATAPERASPKRTHEDGVRESGGGSSSSRRRRIVDIDFEARQEAAAALYSAWRQHALTTTTNTSPKRALEHGAQEGSGSRGGGQRTPESGGSQSCSSACSSDEHSTDMTTPDSDQYVRRRLEPMPKIPKGGKGRGGGKGKGGKGRDRSRR